MVWLAWFQTFVVQFLAAVISPPLLRTSSLSKSMLEQQPQRLTPAYVEAGLFDLSRPWIATDVAIRKTPASPTRL